MDADGEMLAIFNVIADPLDLIRKHVGSRHFHGCRQINHHRLAHIRTPYIVNGVDHLGRKVQLSTRKALGRILKGPVSLRVSLGNLLNRFCSIHCDVPDALTIHPENLLALNGGSGIVDMDDRLPRSFQGFISPFDQLRTGLGEHLNGDVIRNPVFFNQLPAEIKVGLACSRKSDFYLLEANFDQKIKKTLLLSNRHGLDQRLIAIAKINRTPSGCGFNNLVWPATIRLCHGLERNVFAMIESHSRIPARIGEADFQYRQCND